MNKKGSIIMYGMMLGMVVIILALALAPATKSFTDAAMTSMDCSNESISNFYKASCVAVDLGFFQFIGYLILIGGTLVTAKIIF